MTFNTGNPVGSTDARDLYDNAQNLDRFANGDEPEYLDRLGRPRKSLAGIREEVTEALSRLGYQVIGDYAAGLVVQNYGQVFRKDGEFYRAKAETTLPYPLNGDWAVDAPKFVSVGDAVLRQELESPGGAALVGSNTVTVSSISALSEVPTDKGLSVQLISGGRSGLFYWQQGNLSAKVSADPLQGLYVAPSFAPTGASGAWVRQFGQSVDSAPMVLPQWWGAVADGNAVTGAGTNNWAAFQAAIDTGVHVHVGGPGVYRIHEKELQFLRAGQIMSGDGMGSSYGPNHMREHVHHTTLMFTGTGERYLRTRRRPRALVSDPNDAPMSSAICVMNEGVQLRDFAVFCHCNYAADETVANLGADWDTGVFNGSYALMDLARLRVIGYWRVAGVYVDVTYTATLPRFTNPRTGQPFPQGTYSGADKISLNQVWASGGRKGLFVAGAVDTASGDYYDEVSDATYSNQANRGNAGCSEFSATDCFFWGRDHHSGWRAYDPRGDMNFDLEDLDAISAPVVIDGRRGGVSQERLRRFMLTRCRTNTRECVRGIAFGRAYEVYIDDLNTETTSGNSFDTAGNPIAPESAAVNYGPLAVVTPSGVAVGSDSIYVDGINSVPNATHFQNKLTLWSLAGVGSGSTAGRANYNDVRVAGGSWNNNGLSVFTSSAQRMFISDSANVMYQLVRPNVDNSINLGSGTFRWGTIFSATGTINTSDEREKEQQRELYAAERAAAMELKAAMRAFKWKEAVDRKGDSARWHFGVMAQEIQRIFERHGLDAHEYGMFCYDEWDELPQLTHHHPAEIDENGNVIADAWDEVVQEHLPAGNRYGVRYDQLLAFIVAAI